MRAIKFSPIYGNNIGDIAISASIAYLFADRGVLVDSQDILFRCPLSYCRDSVRTGWRLYISSFLPLKLPNLFSLLKKINFSKNRTKRHFLDALQGYDFVIFGGGNLLMSKMGSDYGYRIAVLSKISPIPIVVFSCGAGSFLNDQRFICSTVLNYTVYCSVRDYHSASYLQNVHGHIRPKVTIDPAFIISRVYPPQEGVARDTLGVNVISNFFLPSQLAQLAQQLYGYSKKSGLKIRLINTAFPDDANTAELLKCKIDTLSDRGVEVQIVSLKPDLSNLAIAYQDLRLFVGCRMHSLIFALSYSVPVLAFPWDEKVRAMMQIFLQDAFQEDFILNLNSDITTLAASVEKIRIADYLKQAQEIVEHDVEAAILAVQNI